MEELLSVLKELHPEVDFEIADDLIDSGVLTSLDVIAIISELTEAFDVEIPAEEIVPENFNSAEAMYDMVQRLLDED